MNPCWLLPCFWNSPNLCWSFLNSDSGTFLHFSLWPTFHNFLLAIKKIFKNLYPKATRQTSLLIFLYNVLALASALEKTITFNYNLSNQDNNNRNRFQNATPIEISLLNIFSFIFFQKKNYLPYLTQIRPRLSMTKFNIHKNFCLQDFALREFYR